MTGVFAIAQFRRLVGAWTVGNLADSALFLTLPVWAKDLTGSTGAAGAVFFALALPVLLSPLLGHLADRVHRRPLVIAGNLGAAAAVLALLTVDAPEDVWVIYVVTFLYGALGNLNGAAQSGLLRDLLPDEHLASANATLSTLDQGLRLLTPLLGAGLYTLWGGATLALAVAGCLVLTAGLLALVPVQESAPEPAATASYLSKVAAGYRHLRRTPVLRRMLLASAIAFSVIGLMDSVLFAVVDVGLGREPAFFGVLMSVQGGGSVVGGLTATWVLRRLGGTGAAALGLVVLGLSTLNGLAPVLPVVLVGCFLGGVAIPWFFVAMVTTRQQLTPARLQGRAAAASGMALQVPQLASIAAGAILISVVDYRFLVLVCAVVITSAAALLASGRDRTTVPETAAV